MHSLSDTILVMDHQGRGKSRTAHVLDLLGYTNILYRNYAESTGTAPGEQNVDAAIAVWTDYDIERRDLLLALMGVAKLPRLRGIMVVSPFSTPENAEALRVAGARVWIRYPFELTSFAGRLRYLLEGDKRRSSQTVAFDRRRESAFPAPAAA